MMKKLSIMVAVIFLLLELLFFSSNNAVKEMKKDENRNSVYEVSLEEDKDKFLEDYKSIILEEKDDYLVVLTSSKEMEEIQEKYNVKLENNK